MQAAPENKSRNWLAGLPIQPGSDPQQERMKRLSTPLTREGYILAAGLKEPLTAEEELMLPPEFSRVSPPTDS